jgi:PTS system mannose-specific IID component
MSDAGLRINMFLRSFLVQASWNFERLQNLGFAFLIYPALRRRCRPHSDEMARAYVRHLEFFNTHPYFAGLVAAAVAGEEGGEREEEDFLSDLKRSLMSSLGSVGDAFFWAVLRPLSALFALVPALFGLWWAPLVFLSLFNLPHVALRWWGVSQGLRRGSLVIQSIERLNLPRIVPALSLVLAGMVGFVAAVASFHPRWVPVDHGSTLSFAAGPAIFIAAAALNIRGLSPSKIVLGLAAAILAVGLVMGGTGP